MIVPGSANPLLLARRAGYSIPNSLRFCAINSANLTRTLVAGNRNLWSIGWQGLKRGTLGTLQYLFGADTASADAIYFDTSDRLCVDIAGTVRLVTNAVFRDPSGHYAIKVDFDAANGTAANRLILTVNGTILTSFATDTRSGITTNTAKIGTAVTAYYGRNPTSAANYFDGLMVNCWHVNGILAGAQGQIDATSGAWVPTTPSGMTNNSAGWLLEFKNAASTVTISQDTSSNAVDWTSSGISVTAGVSFDQMIDTPTNNFATLSPINRTDSSAVLADANLSYTGGNGRRAGSTWIVNTGKWYVEGRWSSTASQVCFGVSTLASQVGVASDPGFSSDTYTWYLVSTAGNRGVWSNSSQVFNVGAGATSSDTFQIAYDADSGKLWFGKSDVWYNSAGATTGNPATGTNPTVTYAPNTPLTFVLQANTVVGYINFGQQPWLATPPTNFRALCTANLPTPTTQRGDDAFQATLRTGTGATASVTGLRFAPDLVWPKSRSAATNHNLFDRVRGAQLGLVSNGTAAEYTDANSLTAFNSDGYTFGSDASSRGVNINTNTYVDWAWREGATYGFDVVGYAGDNTSNRNISHANGVATHFAVVKSRSSSNWWAWHRNLSGNTSFLNLNGTGAQTTTNTPWGTGNWSSTQFMVTNNATENANASGTNYVAYLWTSIPGFSLFGSYTGNGSTDGPFVWCGLRPRWVMIKRVDSTGDWYVWDAARNTFNVVNLELLANTAGAEVTATDLDITANGFKFRSATAGFNASGGTFVFSAFAENPFKFANAR